MSDTPALTSQSNHVHILPNNIFVVETQAGAILVNSPPETLKYLLSAGITPPAYILLPPDVAGGQELGSSGFVRRGINYASVEFIIYSNFFVRNQRARLITVTEDQARRLRTILAETMNGPEHDADYGSYLWVRRECAAVSYYPSFGRSPCPDDMVDVVSLEMGGGNLGPTQIRLVGNHFVFVEADMVIAEVSTQMIQMALPLTVAPPRPLHRQELTLQFIGGSDGFDPAGITTCFLAYLGNDVQTQATLFDAAAYVLVRLGHLGMSSHHISEVVLSHLHEDHVAGLPELILMGSHRVRLLTSDIIYTSLLRMLGAMLALPEEEVATLFDYYPLNPGMPVEIEGRRFEAIYAIHSIPTIAVRVNGICYSGDMRYDEDWFTELESRGVLSAERHQELLRFAEGASVLVQDVGGGAIHSTITPRLLQALTAKSQRLVLAHTSKHMLPSDLEGIDGRIEFAQSGHVVAMGEVLPDDERIEMVETISACPLFARLSVAKRLSLALQVETMEWADGATIMQEGDPSDRSAYIVHSGLVEIWIGGAQVRILGRGSSIGERGAIWGDSRSSTMKARGRVQLVRFPPDIFQPIAEQLGLADAFARADWLAKIPVLRDLPWASLLDLALDFQPRQVASGELLFNYGDPGYDGYVLVLGEIAFSDANGTLIGMMSVPGQFFGGRSALYGTPRSASARAVVDSEIWELSAPAIQRLNLLYPNILMHLRAVEAELQRNRKTPLDS